MALFLGIDVGTTSAKAVLARASGEVVAHALAAYPTSYLGAGRVEQQPEDWWAAVVKAVSSVMADQPPAEVQGLGVSGQGCAVTLLDPAGRVLRPAITWQDGRSEAQSAALCERCGPELQRRSGKRPAPYNADPVLMWLAEHEPDALRAAAVSLTTTGYVTYRLSGRMVMNLSDASILCAYDLEAQGWAADLIESIGVPSRLYPDLQPCSAVIGELSPEVARVLGLRSGTPVIAGGEDTSSAALAAGVVDPGQAMVSVGAAGTVNVVQGAPVAHPQLLTFQHVVPCRWLMGGSTAAFGAALDWCRRLLGDRWSFEALIAQAAQSPPGADGLVFLPYLSGELQPLNDGRARGALVGLSLGHEARHVARAVMEGAVFALAHNLLIARSAGAQPTELRASGGPMRSALWRQMLADITGLPVRVSTAVGGAPLGAAMLAAAGVGAVADLLAWARADREGLWRLPEANADYSALAEIYRGLYPSLKTSMHELADLGLQENP